MKQKEFDEKIYNYFAENSEIPQSVKNSINNTKLKEKEKNKFNMYNFNKVAVATLSIVTISTGIVFAKDIEEFVKNMFNDKQGIETAIENEYYYENTLSNNTVSQNVKVSAQNMIMDDYTLNINILAEFDDSIDLRNVKSIYTPDIFIVDEDNNILSYSVDLNAVKGFLEEKGLTNCDNEFVINHSINSTLDFGYNKNDDNSVVLTYNSSISEGKFPKSKKIYVGFNTLILKNEDTVNAESQTINGNWLLVIDVPEKFENRDSISYQVINCNNNNLYKDTVVANISETGMKFEMEMYWGEYEYWHQKTEKLRNEGNILGSQLIKQEESYIENENGEKFYTSLNSGESGYSFTTDGKLLKRDTFNITKYNITDKLKVVYTTIENKQIIIDLQKIN